MNSQALLECIVSAAPEPVARDFNASYKSPHIDHYGVAVYIDQLLCELQEAGLIDAEYHTDSTYWEEAVIDTFGEEEED